MVLGATNRPDMLDTAILRPGRFDDVLELPLPDERGRAEIFKIHLHNKPVRGNIDFQALASRTEDFSGADIYSVCNRAALRAVRRAVQSGQEPATGRRRVEIESGDMDEALEEVRQQGPQH